MNLIKCSICSGELSKDRETEKYICSSRLCQSSFEIMDVNERDNHNVDERAVASYKIKGINKNTGVTYCKHCGEMLVERCSMPTIGSNRKKRTTISTCSNHNCNLEYHIVDNLELKEKNIPGFRIVEIYKQAL